MNKLSFYTVYRFDIHRKILKQQCIPLNFIKRMIFVSYCNAELTESTLHKTWTSGQP